MTTPEILLAAYNGAEYLSEQLDSILRQDTDAWHLTISDDGSSDTTVQIIDAYVNQYPQKIARVSSGTRFGSARDHFFWLMGQCDAEYMLFCDQDDVWHPDKVRLFAQALEEGERQYGSGMPLLVFSDLSVVDQNLKCIHPSLSQMQRQDPHAQDYRNLLFQNTVTGCAVGINRSLADLAGQCRNPGQTVMHDWWLALVAARFGKMVYLDESTVDYRQHGGNSVGAKDVKSLSYILHKLFHLRDFQKNVLEKKRQALVFQSTFQSELTPSEQRTLENFSEPHSALAFKLRFLCWIRTPARRIGFLARW